MTRTEVRGHRRSVGRSEIGLTIATLWFVIVLLVGDRGDLTPESSRMLAIFGAAVVLWITEAIPLAATSILVIAAEVVLVSDEALFATSPGYDPVPYQSYFATLAHPVLILLLGGFMLADAAARHGLDRNLAGVLLRPFGHSPRAILGGLMAITALLSMFMSNTATTATMIAVVLPVAAGLDAADPLRVGMVLAVPVAANIGGIGTPVGSPPNAIALGRLADQGLAVDFLTWMLLAVPIAAVVLVVAWWVVVRLHPPQTETIEVEIGGAFERSRSALILYVTFALTVLGWVTEPFHGVPSAIVGFLPVVVLLSTSVTSVEGLREINWHVLWLVGGGIALGNGVVDTGLDDWLVGLVDWGSMPVVLLAASLALVALTLSTVISNSATANLVVPIAVSLAASSAVDLDPILAGVIVALSCSLAMALPVSTPTNAIAYASGAITVRDLLVIGAVVGGVGVALVVFVAPPVWEAVGLL